MLTRQERAQRVAEKLGLPHGIWFDSEGDREKYRTLWNYVLDLEGKVEGLREKELENR